MSWPTLQEEVSAVGSENSDMFEQKVTKHLSSSMVVFGIELGSRMGLFQVMMDFTEPKTSQEIADVKGYKERYVREWLGLMVAGEIVNITKDDDKYYLPKHRHIQFANKGSFANMSPLIMMCAGVMRDLEQCFKADGPTGIPYKRYPGFYDWRASFTTPQAEWENLEKQLSLVPDIVKKFEEGITYCDLGCGPGTITMTLAEKFPKSTVWGLDISEDGIATGRRIAKEKGLTNTEFHVQDICSLPADWDNKFDFMSLFDVAHDLPFTTTMMKEVVRVLKPGGHLLMIDIGVHSNVRDNISVPLAPALYGISLFHCMAVSMVEEGSEAWGTCWGFEKATVLLKEAGFTDVTMHEGFQAVCKK